MIEEGQTDPEFEAILDVVDPNRDGVVSLQEYMAFMISKETENVHSSEEIQNAFRAIAAGDRPYVLREELYQVGRKYGCWEMISYNLSYGNLIAMFIYFWYLKLV